MKKIVCALFFIVTSTLLCGQPLSLKDSVDLYNGLTVTVDTQEFILDAPDYHRALHLAQSLAYPDGEYRAIMLLGIDKLHQGGIEDAVKSFQHGYRISESMDDPEKQAEAIKYLGVTSFYLEDYDAAIAYYHEALTILEDDPRSNTVADLLNNIGGALMKQEKRDSAMVYIQQAGAIYEANDNPKGQLYTAGNLGAYYLDTDNPERAIQYFQQILKLDMIETVPKAKGMTLANIGNGHSKLGNEAAAIEHFSQGLAIIQQHQFKIKEAHIYSNLAEHYARTGDFEKALLYNNKQYTLKDSISGAKNQERIAALEVQYESIAKEKALLENQQALLQLKERQQTNRLWFGILISGLFALTSIAFITWHRRQRRRQQLRMENEQLKTRHKAEVTKTQQLGDALISKNQALTDFALDIARKNDIAKQLADALTRVHQHLKHPDHPDFKALRSLIASHHQVNEEIGFLQDNVATVNYEFYNALKTTYPSLTQNDLELCGLLRLNLSTKDIARMRGIAPKSIEMSRYRLRKKLSLDKGADLNTFLLTFAAQQQTNS